MTDEEAQESHSAERVLDSVADVPGDLAQVDVPPVSTPGPTLVLAVLADGPMHGYGLAKEIERRSEGYFHARWGSLYPTLQRLESQGLISGEWSAPTAGSGRRRRVYHLTPSGRAEAMKTAGRWREFAENLLKALGAGGRSEVIVDGTRI